MLNRVRKYAIRMIFMVITVAVSFAALAVPASSTANASLTTASVTPASSEASPSPATVTDYPKTCHVEGIKEICVRGSASSSSTSSSHAIANVVVRGRIVGEYFVRGGLTKRQVAGKRCRWTSGGHNSLRMADGSPRAYHDTRSQYVCKTGRGPSGFQVKKCGNPYWPKGWRPSFVIIRNPIVVRSLDSYRLTGSAMVASTSKSKSISETTATCVGSDGYGYGEASATSFARVRIRFYFYSRTRFSGALRNAVIRRNQSLNFTAQAATRTTATTKSKSDASCTDAPPDACPEIPGHQPPGYDCTPPHDECPDIPGDQPEGYECVPPEEDNPPTMVCTVPEHIFVGDDAMWADFDITDPDGDPVSFNEPVLSGPIEMVTTDLTNVQGGKRLSVKFRAMDIPSGTSQTATITVTGAAGGKTVRCSGSVIVENNKTGWDKA